MFWTHSFTGRLCSHPGCSWLNMSSDAALITDVICNLSLNSDTGIKENLNIVFIGHVGSHNLIKMLENQPFPGKS